MIVSRFTLHAASCMLPHHYVFWRVLQRPLRRMATQSHTPASSPRILGPRRQARRTLPSRRVRVMPRRDCDPVTAPRTPPLCTAPRRAACVVGGPPRFVFQHGALTARRRALAEHGGACRPTERVLPGYPDSTPYWRVPRRFRSGHWIARLLRHGRGAARAVRSCAGAYVSGAAGSNACPAGSVRIETEAACRTAAIAAGKTPSTSTSSPFVETDSGYPRGCYYLTGTNAAFFNTHAVGAGLSTQLLCAALVTTGAPPPHAADARARVFTGARVCRHCACAVRCV
jgi:hypothetical protein